VELVLETISNLSSAITWLKSTFLYTRLKKNPTYYGISLNKKQQSGGKLVSPMSRDNNNNNNHHLIDEYLEDLLVENLNSLMEVDLIERCDISNKNAPQPLKSTKNGLLMARYCLAFETMKLFIQNLSTKQESELDYVERTLGGNEKTLEQLV
jgi:replicative superfamily II helicase